MKTQEFLAKVGLEARTVVNAKKETYQAEEALDLVSKVSELLVAKGKKTIHWNLRKDDVSNDEILKVILGPTGNLRAPTLKTGKKLVVGFNEEMYAEVFS